MGFHEDQDAGIDRQNSQSYREVLTDALVSGPTKRVGAYRWLWEGDPQRAHRVTEHTWDSGGLLHRGPHVVPN